MDRPTAVKAKIEAVNPWQDLIHQSDPNVGLLKLTQLIERCRSLPQKPEPFLKVKILLGGNATLNYLREGLAFHLKLLGIEAEIMIAEFNSLQQQALDPSGDLQRFSPDIIWNFSTIHDLAHIPSRSEDPAPAETLVQELKNLWRSLLKNSNLQIIQNNFDLPAERAFGHFENGLKLSKTQLVKLINSELGQKRDSDVVIFDLDWVSSLFGKEAWFSPREWYQGRYSFSPDATSLVAYHGARTVAAMLGRSPKCLVVDLDNTLWGGVAAEDGIDALQLGPETGLGRAYWDFQKYLLELKNRGILLAVCSKNDEELAREVFLRKPGMILKLEDFASFQVNWENKAENLNRIASQLEFSPEAMVFVDDSAFERNLVRSLAPQILVPEMPEDAAEFVRALDRHRYFETVDFSDEDSRRHQLYRENQQRKHLQSETLDLEGYLKSLQMRCEGADITPTNSARAAQLINKSNQFNTTGLKVSPSAIEGLGRAYRLADRFGDHGLISSVLFTLDGDCMSIDNWVMSCRVLRRGVEDFIFSDLATLAKSKKVKKITGVYLKGERNALAAPLYEKLGFRLKSNSGSRESWEFEIQP